MMPKEFIKNALATLLLMSLLIFSYIKLKDEKSFNPFTLQLNTGAGFVTLNELKENKIVLLYFGFLSCPDVCPTTLNTIAGVFKDLPPSELEKISFIFVDLDPERDTIEALKKYSAYFHPKIIPVSLPLKDLDPFTRFFGIAFMKMPLQSKMGYTIDHSTDIIVLSPAGKMLEAIVHGTPKVAIVSQLKKTINENIKP